tara:strand:- start:527 stop:934 length:408 start_codon:yes stop_codon:yes gene_type:complete
MLEKLKKILFSLFTFIFILSSTFLASTSEALSASESDNSILIKKVSSSYTRKFCNAIGFGLSKESAMKFSLEENKQVFKNRKGINNLNKELLAEEIARSVVEQCGYPINLSGEKDIIEFKSYYLSEDMKSKGEQT